MQDWLIGLLVLAAPAAIGGLITYFICRARRVTVEERLRAAQRELGNGRQTLERLSIKLQNTLEAKARIEQDAKQLPELDHRLADLRKENLELKEEIARMERGQEAAKEMHQWIGRAEENLRGAFQTVASQALESQSDEFVKRVQTHMDHIFSQVRGDWSLQKTEFQTLVLPLERSLDALDNQVRELEQKREGTYQKLEGHLQQLGQTYDQLQMSTATLIQALKRSNVRGTWRGVQLRRIVEMAGMTEHVDFNQETANGTHPDMIVHLPNKVVLPVEAKVSMEAYLEAMEAPDDKTRKSKLDTHRRMMRERIRELGESRYRQQFDHKAEVVLLFVPNEACLGVAFERDPELLEYAVQHGVLLTTPITLLALLKALAYGWQQHHVTENARQIVFQGKQLYKRLAAFLGNLSVLGRHLDQTVTGYNKAVESFETRVLPTARRLKETGVSGTGLPTVAAITHQTIAPTYAGSAEEEIKDASGS